jgi:hypothetical protein
VNLESAGVVVRNNVAVANAFGFRGPGSDVDYNLAYGNTMLDWQVTSGDGGHNLFVDPRFVDALDGDFHPDTGSPLVDAGDPAAAYNDRDGSRNDLGLYGGPLAQPGL